MKSGKVSLGRITPIAQWSTDPSRLMVPDSVTGCQTGWIRLENRESTLKLKLHFLVFVFGRIKSLTFAPKNESKQLKMR